MRDGREENQHLSTGVCGRSQEWSKFASLMARERAFYVKGMSMSSRECQFGLATLCTKAKKVDCRWADSIGVCPRTLEMRSWHLTSDPMKAAGA